MIRWWWIAAMPVKKNVVSPLNSYKCSGYQLANQNWHKMQSQSTYFVKPFWVACHQTPTLCMFIVFHTIPFAMALSKGLVHYYYMPQVSKILSTGIAILCLRSPEPSFSLNNFGCVHLVTTNYISLRKALQSSYNKQDVAFQKFPHTFPMMGIVVTNYTQCYCTFPMSKAICTWLSLKWLYL